MNDRIAIRRALLGVSDKTGLIELAKALTAAGVEIVSTGGTAAAIADAGLPVTAVSDVTGFPEMLDGRVKTLHPAIHGGLLGRPADPAHVQAMTEHNITPFQLLVVNLYPFVQTVAAGGTLDDCIENIDIGGPAMVRAAAKNHESVAVVTSPADYSGVFDALQQGGFTHEQRRQLAARAFAHTASYDTAVAQWLAQTADAVDGWPAFAGISATLSQPLRYGENPHQPAALYVDADAKNTGVARGELLQGKEMSYNNYIDADAAWRAAHDQGDVATVAIIKHANPCGIAVGADAHSAYEKALACDPLSAFGGVVALNRPLDAQTAESIAKVFTEVVIAPDFTDAALQVLAGKTAMRLVRAQAPHRTRIEWRAVSGGYLRQQPDALDATGDDVATWTLVCGTPADDEMLADLQFAWRACRAVKSNAILLARNGASVGVGMGQVNRVDSARLAVARAGERAAASVAASDAFFPFADGLQVLIDAGVRAVVQPGGSKRDEEVIAAAQSAGVTMYFTGTRHFAH